MVAEKNSSDQAARPREFRKAEPRWMECYHNLGVSAKKRSQKRNPLPIA